MSRTAEKQGDMDVTPILEFIRPFVTDEAFLIHPTNLFATSPAADASTTASASASSVVVGGPDLRDDQKTFQQIYYFWYARAWPSDAWMAVKSMVARVTSRPDMYKTPIDLMLDFIVLFFIVGYKLSPEQMLNQVQRFPPLHLYFTCVQDMKDRFDVIYPKRNVTDLDKEYDVEHKWREWEFVGEPWKSDMYHYKSLWWDTKTSSMVGIRCKEPTLCAMVFRNAQGDEKCETCMMRNRVAIRKNKMLFVCEDKHDPNHVCCRAPFCIGCYRDRLDKSYVSTVYNRHLMLTRLQPYKTKNFELSIRARHRKTIDDAVNGVEKPRRKRDQLSDEEKDTTKENDSEPKPTIHPTHKEEEENKTSKKWNRLFKKKSPESEEDDIAEEETPESSPPEKKKKGRPSKKTGEAPEPESPPPEKRKQGRPARKTVAFATPVATPVAPSLMWSDSPVTTMAVNVPFPTPVITTAIPPSSVHSLQTRVASVLSSPLPVGNAWNPMSIEPPSRPAMVSAPVVTPPVTGYPWMATPVGAQQQQPGAVDEKEMDRITDMVYDRMSVQQIHVLFNICRGILAHENPLLKPIDMLKRRRLD